MHGCLVMREAGMHGCLVMREAGLRGCLAIITWVSGYQASRTAWVSNYLMVGGL